MDSIVTEVQRGLEFYKSRTLQQVPADCLLNGDGSLLPGLPEYIGAALGIKCQVADPWVNIDVDPKFMTILQKSKPSFSVAVGLALKNY